MNRPQMNGPRVLNFIDGAYVEAASARFFENRNPVDNSLLSMVAEAGEAEVDAAVAAARAALKGPWSRMTAGERAEILHKVADGITRRFEEFLAAERRQPGASRLTSARYLEQHS